MLFVFIIVVIHGRLSRHKKLHRIIISLALNITRNNSIVIKNDKHTGRNQVCCYRN